MESTIVIEVNSRELSTILAGLRLWQWLLECMTNPITKSMGIERLKIIHAIAADSGTPLTTSEIDLLCERINISGELV